jgi:predicted HTH transcriptional regulator
METISYRSYIQMRFKLGISAKQVHSELKNIDEDAPTIQTVHNWFHLFKKGEKNLKELKDKRRSGRPITATTDDNISKIRTFIKSDPYCTYDEIEAEFQISRGTIHNIIHDCLKLKKISSRWIPNELTEQNRKERVHTYIFQ